MKRSLLFLMGTALAATARAQDTIAIGWFENPPWAIPQEGKGPAGASIDFWEKTMAPAMNVKVKWVGPNSFARVLKQLEVGEVDAILVLTKTPEREKLYLYPNSAEKEFQAALALLKSHPLSAITTQDDLAGLKIAYFQGGVPPPFLKESKAVLDMVSSPTWIQDGFKKLLLGRVDAVYNLTIESLYFQAAQGGFADKIKCLALPIPPREVYTAFVKSPRGAALLKKYNEVHDQNPKLLGTLVKKYAEVK